MFPTYGEAFGGLIEVQLMENASQGEGLGSVAHLAFISEPL
jgi:hypothetical protein